MDRTTTILTASDVEAVLGMKECIAAVEEAYGLWGRGEVPDPAVLGVHVDGGGFHVKAATLGQDRRYFVAKTNANFPPNPDRFGLPAIQGVIALFDIECGIPLAVMDSIRITELRTAAATAVAISRLSRGDSRVATLIGCGVQARSHLRALMCVRAFERVWAVDMDTDKAQRFVDEMSGEFEVQIGVTDDLGEALAESDVCVTCTPSRDPILWLADVSPGTTVAAVGADNPVKSEIDPELMAAAKVVADSLEQCAEIGDLHHAIDAGRMVKEDVHAELGDVIAGTRPGRESDDEIIVFDSTGTALQDVASAALVYERALERDMGLRVTLAQ